MSIGGTCALTSATAVSACSPTPRPHRLPYILLFPSHSSENSSRYWFRCYSVTTGTVADCEQSFRERNGQQQGNGFMKKALQGVYTYFPFNPYPTNVENRVSS